jgi:hypothetical protein
VQKKALKIIPRRDLFKLLNNLLLGYNQPRVIAERRAQDGDWEMTFGDDARRVERRHVANHILSVLSAFFSELLLRAQCGVPAGSKVAGESDLFSSRFTVVFALHFYFLNGNKPQICGCCGARVRCLRKW